MITKILFKRQFTGLQQTSKPGSLRLLATCNLQAKAAAQEIRWDLVLMNPS
jgi:hypothetical protein